MDRRRWLPNIVVVGQGPEELGGCLDTARQSGPGSGWSAGRALCMVEGHKSVLCVFDADDPEISDCGLLGALPCAVEQTQSAVQVFGRESSGDAQS